MLTSIFIFLISFLHPTESQQSATQKYDMVDNKSIQIKNGGNAAYALGSAAQLQKAFGKTKISKQNDEMLGGYDYIHKYKGLIVNFNEKEFEDVTVTGSQYQVYLNGQVFKIGDNDTKVKKVFPLAYAERSTQPDHTRILRIQISHNKVMTDAAVVITLNAKAAITEIWIGNDNS
ncbi:hypothetical protein MUGA111182_00985 [Mucilaginibacter galii]|nr:hypothetical protein [Mucilaginibacter galii]